MHCFGHSTYALKINTKLVFLLEAFGENEWFVLLMKGAYIFPSQLFIRLPFFCLWIQRWNSSFVSSWADVLETTKLISEDKQNSSPSVRRVALKNSIFLLCSLLSLDSFYELLSGKKENMPLFCFRSVICLFSFGNRFFNIAEWETRKSVTRLKYVCSRPNLECHQEGII